MWYKPINSCNGVSDLMSREMFSWKCSWCQWLHILSVYAICQLCVPQHLWYIGIIFILLYSKVLIWSCAMSMAQRFLISYLLLINCINPSIDEGRFRCKYTWFWIRNCFIFCCLWQQLSLHNNLVYSWRPF